MTRTQEVDALLARRIGLDPGTIGASLIAQGLQARMSALGIQDRAVYERFLRGSVEEQQELIEEVVVPESWFFRDEQPFHFLQSHARQGWLETRERPPLRALSLPCAGGEEPYSIAIALRDAGLPADRIHVDAVDVSERSLTRARRGLFSRNAFRGQDVSFRARYFQKQPDGYELDPSIRDSVRFIRGNLVDPSLLAGETPYDVIFCRNLLIYLTGAARTQASSTLVRLLSSTGLLFLGHADRLEFQQVRFVPAGEKGSFAYRRDVGSPAAPAPSCPPAPARGPAPPGSSKREPPGSTMREKGRPSLGTDSSVRQPSRSEPVAPPRTRAGPASPSTVDASTVRGPSLAVSLLDQAAELADQGKYEDAVALVELSLRESGASAHGYFLLGMIRQAAGERDQAEAAFQKTVYLDTQHDEALLALALLAERRGDLTSALGFRRRAERALARKGVP